MPYEGPTLHSVHLELMPAGKLQGEIVVSFTDSGTVTDTVLLDGHWKATGDTVRLTYRWSRPRWQKGPRTFHFPRPVTGIVSQSALSLPDLAFLDHDFFGAPTPMHFRRVSEPLHPNKRLKLAGRDRSKGSGVL